MDLVRVDLLLPVSVAACAKDNSTMLHPLLRDAPSCQHDAHHRNSSTDQQEGRFAARRSAWETRPAASSLRAMLDDTAAETPGALPFTMAA